jgi:hypothetical protein
MRRGMPSKALDRWHVQRLPKLDELEAAHQAMGGQGPGRRYVTGRINDAYVVLLAAEWQGFCRDLHSEAADSIAAVARPAALQGPIRTSFTSLRRMDRGNANAAEFGTDFGRLGMAFWPSVEALHKLNSVRKRRLQQLYGWRNSIVHQDPPDPTVVGDTSPTLRWARTWRGTCDQLAEQLDRAVGRYVALLVGAQPW